MTPFRMWNKESRIACMNNAFEMQAERDFFSKCHVCQALMTKRSTFSSGRMITTVEFEQGSKMNLSKEVK